MHVTVKFETCHFYKSSRRHREAFQNFNKWIQHAQLEKFTDIVCLNCCQAETRAEFAERTVAKLEKTIDDLEGMRRVFC